ncbi:hypothetical protein VTP01DRAFT_4800 [Rhizomucor pusillus]|uniref:uncharacterized protein n=1 Tax=Rhizomucor pusillus TaxID=4840 RepID=UPI003744844F
MAGYPDRMAIDDESSRVRTKGRGFASNDDSVRRSNLDAMDEDKSGSIKPQRSVEGWIIIVRGLNPETDEESLSERFAEYGTIKNLHLNLDRRTGFVKGYALIEYETLKEAQAAIDQADGTEFYDHTLKVDFAFVQPNDDRSARRGDRNRQRDRSQSPSR